MGSAGFRLGIAAMAFGCLSWMTATEASAKTLRECFEAALGRSTTVGTNMELVRQAEARYYQAVGSAMPTITGSASYFQQEPLDSPIYPTVQPLIKATLTQPLFQGFKEFAGIAQGKKTLYSTDETRRQAVVQLYQDTATAFYAVLSSEIDLVDLNEEIELYEKRIKELRQFVTIGRSRENDVLTAQVQAETLRAQAELLKMQIANNREVIVFLTGFPAETPLSDDEPDVKKASPLPAYLEDIDKRPDIVSARLAYDAAHEGVGVAVAGWYPTVAFTGNAYALRYGVQNGVHWDAQLTLTVPIFTGGIVQAGVDLARSQRMQADFAIEQVRRTATQQVRTFYTTLVGDQNQVTAYDRVVDVAKRNYEVALSDYRKGLTNNIDVLNDIASYKESERAYDRTRFSVKLDFARIESSVARRPNNPAKSRR